MKPSSGGGGGTQTTTSKTELPQWLTNATMSNLNMSYNAADNMLGPWTGPRVATMTPGMQADIGLLQQTIGGANPTYNFATNALAGMTQPGMTPQVNPGSIARSNLSSYMNPFTENVIGSGMKAIDMAREQALNSEADRAISQQAFGGSRHGVMEGVTNAEAARQAGDLASQLKMASFTNAQQMAGQDLGMNLQGQLANQNAYMNGLGLNLAAARGMGELAGAQQNSMLQSIMAAVQGQSMMQGQQQALIDADRQAYTDAQQFPLQQIQIPLQSVGMTPYGTTQTQQAQLPPGNGLMSGLGAAAGGIGLLGSLFGSGGAFPLVGASSLLR